MFKDPLLNKLLKQARRLRWKNKHPGVISTYGAKRLGRKSKAYAIWRKAVLKRDGFKCVQCGASKGLQAHHNNTWGEFKGSKSRYDVRNGMTLCFNCHAKLHPWMRREGVMDAAVKWFA